MHIKQLKLTSKPSTSSSKHIQRQETAKKRKGEKERRLPRGKDEERGKKRGAPRLGNPWEDLEDYWSKWRRGKNALEVEEVGEETEVKG